MFYEGHALGCRFQWVTTFEKWLEADMTKSYDLWLNEELN